MHAAPQRTGGAGNLASSIKEILAEVDKDGDGRIDYQEFCDMMRGQACRPYSCPCPCSRCSVLSPLLSVCRTVNTCALSWCFFAGWLSRPACQSEISTFNPVVPWKTLPAGL